MIKKYILSVLLVGFSLQNLFSQIESFYFFQADSLSSEILWKCDKHSGKINLDRGGFVLENGRIVGGLFYIDMTSLKDLDMSAKEYGTAVMILENTLKNEFFEVEKYPEAVFEIQEIVETEAGKYKITGDFTLHGISICLSFETGVKISSGILSVNSEKILLDRTDWGVYRLSPQRPYADDKNGWTVPDEIEIQINIKAKKLNQ